MTEHHAGVILETHEALGEKSVIADPAQIVSLCGYLKFEEKFVRLSTVTAVDWHPAAPRFEVVYQLHSLERNARLRDQMPLGRAANPEIESVTGVWRGANWYEWKSGTCSASASAITRTWTGF